MYKKNNIYLGNNGKKYMYIGDYYTYIHSKKGPHLPELENFKKMYGIDREGVIYDSKNPMIVYSIRSKEKKHIFIRDIDTSNPGIVSSRIIERNLNGVSYPAGSENISKAEKLIKKSLKINDINDTPIKEYIKIGKKNIVTKNNKFFKLIIDVKNDGSFEAILDDKVLNNVFNDELLFNMTRTAYENNVKNNTNIGLGGWNPYYDVWKEAFEEMDNYLENNGYTPVNIFYNIEGSGSLYTINDLHMPIINDLHICIKNE